MSNDNIFWYSDITPYEWTSSNTNASATYIGPPIVPYWYPLKSYKDSYSNYYPGNFWGPLGTDAVQQSSYGSDVFWIKPLVIENIDKPYNLADGYTGYYETIEQGPYTSDNGNEYKGTVRVISGSTGSTGSTISSPSKKQYIWPNLGMYSMNYLKKLQSWRDDKTYYYNNNYVLPLTMENQNIDIPFGLTGNNYSNFSGVTGGIDPQLLDGTYLVGQTGPTELIKPVKFEDAKNINSYVLDNGSAFQESKTFYTYIPVNSEDDSKATDFDYNKLAFNQLVPKNYVDQLYSNIVGTGNDNTFIINKKLYVSGSANVNSNLDVTGDTKLKSNLDVSGSVNLQDTLNVAANAFFKSYVVSEGTVIGNNIVAYNAAYLSSLNVNNSATISSNLGVNGVSTLGVTGSTGADALFVNGKSVFMGDITYYGNLSIGTTTPNTGSTGSVKTALGLNSITTEILDTNKIVVGDQTKPKSETTVLTINQLSSTTTDLLSINSSGDASVKINNSGSIVMKADASKITLGGKEVDSSVIYLNDLWCIVTDNTKSLAFYYRKTPISDWKCGIRFKTGE